MVWIPTEEMYVNWQKKEKKKKKNCYSHYPIDIQQNLTGLEKEKNVLALASCVLW